ncbi:hypothetical protein EBU99_12315 [bacterium]|nr:hypothetical protein [bacterium]
MYNALLSYEENLRRGPFSEWNSGGFFPRRKFLTPPRFSFLRHPLHLPLGIPAGPLLSTAFVKVALEAGFSMPVYKTVRSCAWASHPWPNVLSVQVLQQGQNNGRPQATVVPLELADVHSANARTRLSITNAFGVPSLPAQMWSEDFKSLPSVAFQAGAMAVLSFQGSRRSGETWNDFLLDTERCSTQAAQTVVSAGGNILEMNVSCPNEAGAPIYTDLLALRETLQAAANGLSEFSSVKLIVKLGILPDDLILPAVEIISKYAHGISAINTLSANIIDPQGGRALGSGAEHGGICGDLIRAPALKMISQLHLARKTLGLHSGDFALVGVGGCSTAQHLQMFLDAGADVVHAATGAMWNLQLASECARALDVPFSCEE